MILSEPAIKESEEGKPLFDITGKPVDNKDKGKRKISDSDAKKILEKREKNKIDEKKNKKSFEEVESRGRAT